MESRHFPARTVVFKRERNGVTYRIPALLYIAHSRTLLAFAEERLSPADIDAKFLVLRSGTFYRSYVEWEDMKALQSAHLKNHRSMNPCPVYDEFTGTVFLFFIAVLGNTSESYQLVTGKNVTRLCYITSTDQGRSWSSVTDLTETTIGSSIKGWATFALGPGHGIQLKSGRLVIPAYTYHIDCKVCFEKKCNTTPHSFTFYSDTHGKIWKFGEFIPNLETLENQVVSVDEEDGTTLLYCNARSSLGFRVQAVSFDDGAVFETGQLVQKLVEPPHGCHGSIIGFPAPFEKNCIHPLQGNAINRETTALTGAESFKPSAITDSYCINKDCQSTPFYAHLNENQMGLEGQQDISGCSDISNLKVHNPLSDPNNCCKGAILLSSSKFKLQTPTWMLHSHPTSPTSRINMGIYLSTFPRDPDSWTDPWVIYEGPSAYSDLASIELHSASGDHHIPAMAFACLYESGHKVPYEEISFSMFTLYELVRNIPYKAGLQMKMNRANRVPLCCPIN